jgi:hypothetical protein
VDLWAKVPNLEPEARFERARALALLSALVMDAKSGVTAAEAATLPTRPSPPSATPSMPGGHDAMN